VSDPLRLVAFYLPQFHPIPENDAWWGKGFTEWTNVTKAAKLFADHEQPHLPTELGFYDLRVRDTQRDQAALARAHGIDAFCFHYYWFAGKRLLERPVDDFLADPTCDIGFCLCWANENWTRRWDASDDDILMAQTYSPENDVLFIASLLRFFADPRYLRVDGAPVLLVYRPQHMPDAAATAQRWRARCREAGIASLHLVACLTHGNEDFAPFGYDAGMEFPPHNVHATAPGVWPANLAGQFGTAADFAGCIWDYTDIAQNFVQRDYASAKTIYRCVFPCWDNTARQHKRAFIMQGGTPENYECWLREAAARTRAERAPPQQLLFINAWNEWAEGCHLEPDRRHGRGFLEATLRVKQGRPNTALRWQPVPRLAQTPPPAASRPLVARAAAMLARMPVLYAIARGIYRLLRKVAVLF
jgi:lipopolysaccharide biosynthesis protein